MTAGTVAREQTQQFIQALRQFRLQNIADSIAQLGAAKAQAERAQARLNQAEQKLAADRAAGAPSATINADQAEVTAAKAEVGAAQTNVTTVEHRLAAETPGAGGPTTSSETAGGAPSSIVAGLAGTGSGGEAERRRTERGTSTSSSTSCPPGEVYDDDLKRCRARAKTPSAGATIVSSRASEEKTSTPSKQEARRPRRAATPVYLPVKAPVPLYAPARVIPAVWAQGTGDWERRDSIAGGVDYGYRASTYGALAGVDFTLLNLSPSFDAMVWGLVGSTSTTNINYNNSAKGHLTGNGAGVYWMYITGALTYDIIAKADFYGFSEDALPLAAGADFKLRNYSLAGDVKYKYMIGSGGTFVEPVAGFIYTLTDFDAPATLQNLRFGDALRLQGGARVGTDLMWAGIRLTPSVTGLIYSDVSINGSTLQTAPFTTAVAPSDDQGKIRGEVDLSVNAFFGGGLSGWVQASTRFGDDLLAVGAKIGLRQDLSVIPLGYADAGGGTYKARPTPRMNYGQIEFGPRYVYGWGGMSKDFYSATTPGQLDSRLTYRTIKSHAGEIFARWDAPNPFFLKGDFGLGYLSGGTLNDEDFPPVTAPYSNTASNLSQGRTTYINVDAGYNVLKGQNYKAGPMIGYQYWFQGINAYGCTQVSTGTICSAAATPPQPTSVVAFTETEKWQALRLGVSGEVMLTDRIKLTAEAAYLPYVRFDGTDNHWLNAAINPLPETGHGDGYQFEGLLSYYLTNDFSVGIGGRYWSMRTTSGNFEFPGAPNTPGSFKTDRAAVFLQAAYKLGSER